MDGYFSEYIGRRVFVIAEIGNNHNGSMTNALKLIDLAIEAGADAVKFQMRDLQSLYRRGADEDEGEDLAVEYSKDILRRFQLTVEQHKNLRTYCRERDIIYLCTPWDKKSVGFLSDFDIPFYKVASADLLNFPLLEEIAAQGKPLIVSSGMHTEKEIIESVDFLNKLEVPFCLLHCNSTYPAPFADINLSYIQRLKKIHSCVGYSGHERGIAVTLAAIALGAEVIERHITLDRELEGPDHSASLEGADFIKLVAGIREIELALGNGKGKQVSQGELINKQNLGKSLVASRSLKKGDILSDGDIQIKSPGRGVSPNYLPKFVGKPLAKSIRKNEFFYLSHIGDEKRQKKKFDFNLKWGIPVRYHDFSELKDEFSPDLWEFHLSYKDMDLDIDSIFKDRHQGDLVVHAPELFANSRLLDLSSPDLEYRKFSIEKINEVIQISKGLTKYFESPSPPKIVVNVGGFSMDSPLTSDQIRQRYETFADSLNRIHTQDVLLLPQTMAPFPWHFGGQRYQNLFLTLEDLLKYAQDLNLNYCFDVSHSYLYCNHKGIDFYKFSECLMPFVKHLHIADGCGTNSEGLQIGEGSIDFSRLGRIIKKTGADPTFIPEVWQGHVNVGEGFYKALTLLQGKF